MKILHACQVVFLVALVATAAEPQGSEDAKNDLAKLRGEWVLISSECGGISFEHSLLAGYSRRINDQISTITLDDKVIVKARFRLNPGVSPKAIDFIVVESTQYQPGDKLLGIYDIQDDKLRICIAMPEIGRPDRFVKKLHRNDWVLQVWQKKPNRSESK